MSEDSETCAKCGQDVETDWWEKTEFPEPLCAGCSHGQMHLENDDSL